MQISQQFHPQLRRRSRLIHLDCRIEVPSTLSAPLRNLLHSLLMKDPLERPPIPSLWDDPWITAEGRDPLPDYDENVWTEIDEPSGEEVTQALATLRGSTFLAMSAAAKFKSLLKRSSTANTSSDGGGGGGATTPPRQVVDGGSPQSSPAQSPVLVDSPEFVASPTATSTLPSSPLATGGSPSAVRRTTRPTPRYQATVSSLSIGDAASRWQLSPTSSLLAADDDADPSVTQQSEGPVQSESPQEEKEVKLTRSPSSSPTLPAAAEQRDAAHEREQLTRSPSPTVLLAGTDKDGEPLAAGTEHPSARMQAAGVDREDLERLQPDEPGQTGQVWEDPE